MKRIAILGGLIAAACVPAIVGLVGNASFGDSVPVRVPDSAVLTTGPLDDRGGFTILDDDGTGVGVGTPTASSTAPSTTSSSTTSASDATTATSTTGTTVDDHGGTGPG